MEFPKLSKSIKEITTNFDTDVRISKVRQRGIICGYGEWNDYLATVSIICDICRNCGSNNRFGKAEKCFGNHSWLRTQAIEIIRGTGESLEIALSMLDAEAIKFNDSFSHRSFRNHHNVLEWTELRRENESLKSELSNLRYRLKGNYDTTDFN